MTTHEISWQLALKDMITQPRALLDFLNLDQQLLPEAEKAAQQFPLKVTKSFAERMQKNNPYDPLLRQVLPLGIELAPQAGFQNDPLREANKNPFPALLHKFSGRVLVIVTGACAIHCRYCFRRHFPYQGNQVTTQTWQRVIDYVEANPSISEMIFSGGDPLMISDEKFKIMVQRLEDIPHMKRLRIHSRLPIVLPERITSALLNCLKNTRLQTSVVIHCNHPQELNDDVKTGFMLLKQSGVTLLNQSVLLKGVNDTVPTLVELSEKLFEYGVLPYYLFLLDKVTGAQHFDLPIETALRLHQGMSAQLPGYLLPKLAKEEPGAASKWIISSTN